jgi:ferrous-iron efflux pump FieF
MSDPRLQEHGSLTARAAIASVSMALFLLALKAYAAWATGSVAMLGSLADTAFDVFASLITLFGVRLAAQPADPEHRFGHGKAEALAALVQVALIAVSATGILWRAIDRLRNGGETQGAEFGIGVSIVAILSTFLLLAYQRRVIARTGSVAIHADNVHYQSDLLLNGSVIVALVLEQFAGLRGADPVFGIGIALWLVWGAWTASSRAIDQLMDREWPEEKRQRFVDLANAQAGFRGIHDLRTRTSGAHDFAQFHAWVDPQMTIAEAHHIVEAAEQVLETEFPGTEVLIHLDPEGQIDRAGQFDEDLRETPET